MTWQYPQSAYVGTSPTGTASGDLSASYPNPTVAKVNGTTITGTPADDKVLVATGATAGSWQTQTVRHAAGVPTGAPTAPEIPVALDSTAVTGGLYVWTGAAWVKGSTIP